MNGGKNKGECVDEWVRGRNEEFGWWKKKKKKEGKLYTQWKTQY